MYAMGILLIEFSIFDVCGGGLVSAPQIISTA